MHGPLARPLRPLLTAVAGLALLAMTADAGASETGGTSVVDDVELTYFYPYTTSYRQVDPGYAFSPDPLRAFVREPYALPIVVPHVEVRRSLVKPRLSFVDEVARTGDVL